eukprot:9024281-Alexandrium_andersonii.AAC.1
MKAVAPGSRKPGPSARVALRVRLAARPVRASAMRQPRRAAWFALAGPGPLRPPPQAAGRRPSRLSAGGWRCH